VGAAPGFRDRGAFPVLQRDFVLGRNQPYTLRLHVPPGVHRVHLLTGDTDYASGNTIVREDGRLLAESGNEIIPEGQFRWFGFDLDGGATGRTADLELTGDLREGYWRLGALVMLPVRVV
jgi:alpha-glucuronidase